MKPIYLRIMGVGSVLMAAIAAWRWVNNSHSADFLFWLQVVIAVVSLGFGVPAWVLTRKQKK